MNIKGHRGQVYQYPFSTKPDPVGPDEVSHPPYQKIAKVCSNVFAKVSPAEVVSLFKLNQ